MHVPARAVSILFLSIFGHKIDVLKSPALFQGNELQVTSFKFMRFCKNKKSSFRSCKFATDPLTKLVFFEFLVELFHPAEIFLLEQQHWEKQDVKTDRLWHNIQESL